MENEDTEYHKPVMVEEVVKFLNVEAGKRYIDATLGDGGHTIEILKRGAYVLGIDFNDQSIQRALYRIKGLHLNERFVWARGNFRHLEKIAYDKGFINVDGILFDLGVSTSQLRDERLGLSFDSEFEPDMRLDSGLSIKAFDLINGLYEKELANLFRIYGQERCAKVLAKAIVKARKTGRISSSKELAEIAKNALPFYERGRIHPATRMFMALRIAVNDELENLKLALPQAGRLLNKTLPRGRMVVISFHSLEDKIVKNFAQSAQLVQLFKKPIRPSLKEVKENPSARSAKVRVFEAKSDA